MNHYPYVITVSSEKGGVGKTTLATNLAIFLKALDEEMPVSIFSFDNHFSVDKMFSIQGQEKRGDVADLLMETPAAELLHTGQYGVNYIPSSNALSDLKHSVKGPLVLARLLADSNIPGILIIDTRPDLDVLTQNALFAADRVIIPVKDMPSLENCRNIFELFDKRGLDKKSLMLIPCLIDSRIKFDGPFRDQRSLLKAYAINRGYRCFDTFISKSPKVESLNTNPDGRIFPILTYARGTEVFNQFMTVGRTIIAEVNETIEPRALLFSRWQTAENGRRKEAFFSRLGGLSTDCLCCGKRVLTDVALPGSYYYESSDNSSKGFLDEACLLDFLMSSVYRLDMLEADDPTRILLQSSARESVFALKYRGGAAGQHAIEFSRFDGSGTMVSRKAFSCARPEVEKEEKVGFYSIMSKVLSGFEGGIRENAFLLIHHPHPEGPEAILMEENYRRFARLKQHISVSVME